MIRLISAKRYKELAGVEYWLKRSKDDLKLMQSSRDRFRDAFDEKCAEVKQLQAEVERLNAGQAEWDELDLTRCKDIESLTDQVSYWQKELLKAQDSGSKAKIELAALKSRHDRVMAENNKLQAETLRLRAELRKAQRQTQKGRKVKGTKNAKSSKTSR